MNSDMEHKFTSTGIKFWRHPSQMAAYRNSLPTSVISTHISPTSGCNLNCSFCSVRKRTEHNQIPIEVIKDYITKLRSCGLKAVILTGGGEPLMYEDIKHLIIWLHYTCKLKVALITNGTLLHQLNAPMRQALSWVRLSLNNIPRFLERVDPGRCGLLPGCTIGGSIVHSGKNKDWEWLKQTKDLVGLEYVRMLPDCSVPQDQLAIEHQELEEVCRRLDDPRYFHQDKNHATPQSTVCHQSYFRPYLSEEPSCVTGEPGSVYPCDSVVLNEEESRFTSKFQLCPASEILEYLHHSIKAPFTPCEDCGGCVFAGNIDMLEQWNRGKLDRFAEFAEPLKHEEFV